MVNNPAADLGIFPGPSIKPSGSEHTRLDEQYQIFVAKVVRVDHERKVVSIRDSRTGITHTDVVALPSNSSSASATDMDMPEIGTACIAVALEWQKGSGRHAIINYVTSDTLTGQDAVGQRALNDAPSEIAVWTERTRGVYRKAYPGQHTITKTEGYTAKFDLGWDMAGVDFSRDELDTFRRTRKTSTGRTVDRTDASLKYEGYVHRPQADLGDIKPHLLPDGSKEWILYLDYKEKDWKTRYFDAQQDMMPFVEHVEKIQEFGLDYPVPHEVYETDMWDQILGLTDPWTPSPDNPKDWWHRTQIQTKGMTKDMQYDDETFLIKQNWDHPTDTQKNPGVGPTLKEGKTPRRRGWMIEKAEGTVVGSNMFDKGTYGKVLKPVIFPLTKEGRFGTDTESGYTPITKLPDQVEAKMAASAWSMRFPYEYNTTRFDITKEGLVQFEVGSTIPKEKIVWDNFTYEHPHGAGRSVEGHFLGSVKLAIGKNRDEEESLDIQTVGGAVLRLGADDASLPDFRRKVMTQIRSKKDVVMDRQIQFWDDAHVKLTPGDCGDLANKTGAENVSLRAAMDGGMFLRVGARHPGSKRRHMFNGYKDGPGVEQYGTKDSGRKDARTKGRPCYTPPGDATYRFHNLATAGAPVKKVSPYEWSGSPGDPDKLGLSADIHTVKDLFIRAGTNTGTKEGISASLDFAGALIAALGKDAFGRSIIGTLDGGIEMTVGELKQKGKSIRLEINGDVDIAIRGNLHLNVTGDITTETCRDLTLAKLSSITRSLKVQDFAQTLRTNEAPEHVNHQGGYPPSEESDW